MKSDKIYMIVSIHALDILLSLPNSSDRRILEYFFIDDHRSRAELGVHVCLLELPVSTPHHDTLST